MEEISAAPRASIRDWQPTEAEKVDARFTHVHILVDGYEQKVTFITQYAAAWYTKMVQFIDINNKRYTFMLDKISFIESIRAEDYVEELGQ